MLIESPDQEYYLRNYRYNFSVNLIEGALFWFSYSFIAPSVILPVFVSHLTSSTLLIGMVAVLSSTGYFFPQLFTSNWVQKTPLKKNIPVRFGLFTERIPLVFLPFATLLVPVNPALTLSLFFILFGWHSFGAGVVAVGWQEMIAKIFPQDRRGLFLGLTSATGTAMGVAGASLAAYLLDHYAFPYGFAICFGLGAGFILLSWTFLSLVREKPSIIEQTSQSLKAYWQGLPGIIRQDRNFRMFLLSQLLITFGGMAWAFMAVYARQTWQLSDGRVGTFTIASLIGQAIGNLGSGILADKKGYKLVLLISVATTILSLILGMVAPSPEWFYLAFGLRGLSFGGFFVSIMIVFEMSVPAVRPTYIGINNTLLGIFSLLAPMLGGLIAGWTGYVILMGISLVVSLAGIVMLAVGVREPRSHPPISAAEVGHA